MVKVKMLVTEEYIAEGSANYDRMLMIAIHGPLILLLMMPHFSVHSKQAPKCHIKSSKHFRQR